MSDLISRQDAIDAFLTELTKRERKNLLHTWSTVEVKYFITEMLEKLPSTQSERKWIPCSERLPEEKDAGILKKLGTSKKSEYVLATVEVKGERMTVTACTYDGKWDWNMKYAFPDYEVIAWMPLPEPYREEVEHERLD